MTPTIILKEERGIARLIINRMQSLNSLDKETLLEIKQAFEQLRGKPELKIVVISGAGGRAFSVGADIKGGMFSLETTPTEAIELSRLGQRVLKMIEDFERPVIAAVDGYALGGGFELALACDLIIASERSSFGQVEINLDLIPGWGGSRRLAMLVGKNRAKSMILTGGIISAREAEQMGIVYRIIPDTEFERNVDQLAEKLASKGATALSLAKSVINKSFEADLVEASEYEAEAFSRCFATPEYKQRLNAFLKKRELNST